MSEAVDLVRAEYDAVPYESLAFPQSAPGQLAAIGHLFGLEVPDVPTARVLEIGCSSGGNLIPFAAGHPQARAVGIDLSPVQIDQGRRNVRALGLDNLELVHADIADMDLSGLGQFDFVICHGVYSWVPDTVQDAILAAIEALLVPTGIAYVSYNTYPGWKAKEIIRDAMLMRGGGRGTPKEKLAFARGMIDFLASVAPSDSVLGQALTDYRETASHTRDYYQLHEYLEAFNAPCYFLDMLERAKEHRLTYLAEATPHTMFAYNYGESVAEPLMKECGHSQVLLEQYLDFVVNRTFRQTMLVHQERAPQIRYQLDRQRYHRMHFAAWLPAVDGDTVLDASPQGFGDRDAVVVTTADPAVKAALDALTEAWPWTLSRPALADAARKRLAAGGIDAAVDTLEGSVDTLLDLLIARGMARFRLDPVVAPGVTAPRRLDETARRMAESSRWDANAFTFNQWHETLLLSPVDRHLVPLLDGTRDVDDLADALVALARDNVIPLDTGNQADKQTMTDGALRDAAVSYVKELPQHLAAMKLCIAP